MNDITGMDIVKFTKKYSPDTKVILITGDDTIGDAFGAVMDGAGGLSHVGISEHSIAFSINYHSA